MNLEAEGAKILQVLDQYTEGWIKGDINLLKGIWSKNDEQITYIPVETTEIIRGVKDVETYYEETVKWFHPLSLELSDTALNFMGDYAHVAAKADIVVQNADGTQTTVHPRLSFVLQHKENQWFVIHYAESATVQ